MSLQIEKALRGTPLSRGVALVMRRDDIERPLLTLQPDGSWLASIYAVRRNGLPLWWPRSANRQRPSKFVATFVARASELSNMLRAHSAAKQLLEAARKKLADRKRGLKTARTTRRTIGFARSPGRPPGILRSMEKTGSNRARLCIHCDAGHHNQQRCPPQGESL